MIAIPIDSASPGEKSSKLFGNVEMFAMKSDTIKYPFIHVNRGSGDGLDTVDYLKKEGIRTVVYTHMGEGVFKALDKSDINVFYIGKEPMKVDEILEGLEAGAFVKVEPSNANEYLDSGMPGGSCACSTNDD